MDKRKKQQQRYLQDGIQRQGHNPPMLALEDLHPDDPGVTRHGPVLDPDLQQQRQGPRMTRHGPVIDPAMQKPAQRQDMTRRELGTDSALQHRRKRVYLIHS